MTNPAGLSYAKVIGHYQMFRADSLDSDDLPDFVEMEGTATITPGVVEAHNLNPGLESVYLPQPFEVTVVNGWLTSGGNPWVNVLRSPVGGGVTPTDFTYTIKLNLRELNTNGPYTAYGPFSFAPTPDVVTGVVDLALATPVASSGGTPMTAGATGSPGDMATVVNTGNVTGAVTLLSTDLPTTRLWTLTGNVTLTLPTPGATRSGTITLVMTQDGTGSRTITWPAAVKWPEGISQQPSTTAGSITVFHLLWTGTAWLGLLGGKSFA